VLNRAAAIDFAEPDYRWLLVAPAVLLVLWAWRASRRVADLRRLHDGRISPVRERWSWLGDLPLWFCVVAACAAFSLAVARPRGVAPRFGRAGLDIVVLQDGSASMYVRDVPGGTRWSRAMQFLRRMGDALRWTDDRLALTVFARIATPQVRLTRDPNTVFFFLDHLGDRPPFPLTDETTWDTNLEQGIGWGLRVLQKDREIHGPSANAPLFLLLTDGETWSGEVARAIEQIRDARIPLFVAGVGTLAGGRMPPLPFPDDGDPPPTVSRLDRAGLQRLAVEGRGLYFELDRDRDRDIANAIIDAGRRSVAPTIEEAAVTDLYWPLLAVGYGLAALGACFARRGSMLGVHAAGAAATVATAVWLLS
jgi:hypothetical protein